MDRRWEKLDDLQDFDLEPWARRHIVEVVLRVLLHVGKDRDELGQQGHVVFVAKNLDCRP